MNDEAGGVPVVYRAEDFSLVVEGEEALVVADPAAIDAVIAGLSGGARGGSGRARRSAPSDALAALSSLLGAVATSGELFRLSPETAAKLADGHEFIAEVAGRISGQLRDSVTKDFAGSAKFDMVDLGPEQALSLQMAMTSIALRVAISDVIRAVEAVGADVEVIRRRLESRQVGDVVADYDTMRNLVDLLESTGRLSNTDWGTVAALGPRVRRDLRSLREFVSREVAEAAQGGGADDRADALDRIEALSGDLELLAVAEASLHLWHVLRVQHLWDTERDHVPGAIDQARADLAAHRSSDRALLDELRALGETMTRVDALEYPRLFSRRALARDVAELNDMLRTFASHRVWEYDPIPEVDQPSAREAIDAAQSIAREVSSGSGEVARMAVSWVRSRSRRDRRTDDRPEKVDHGDEPSPALEPGQGSNIPTIAAPDQIPVEQADGPAEPAEEAHEPD